MMIFLVTGLRQTGFLFWYKFVLTLIMFTDQNLTWTISVLSNDNPSVLFSKQDKRFH